MKFMVQVNHWSLPEAGHFTHRLEKFADASKVSHKIISVGRLRLLYGEHMYDRLLEVCRKLNMKIC